MTFASAMTWPEAFFGSVFAVCAVFVLRAFFKWLEF